ncbi:AMP-binding protein [Streptomyces sp. NPDC006435]|uniref:AMP-binding protein n=1 Tax=Streptomyces sp. NPDC006435 TaxID=3154300 RepID=UPI00339E897E
MTNLASVLTDAAGLHPRRPALRIDGTVLALLDLDELSARVAGGLLAHGVRPGDRVEVAVCGDPVLPVLYFGALRAGAIVVVAAPLPRSVAVRSRGSVRGARLVFAPPVDRIAAGRGANGTTVVRVGPDFLDQVAFWPQHPGVVHRGDGDVAVVAGAVGRLRSVYTHGAARAAVAAAGGGPLSAPGLPGGRPALRPRGRGPACLVGARLFAPLTHAAGSVC